MSYLETSIEIAREAGCALGAIYNLVEDMDEIVKALNDSYTYAHAAIGTITAQNAFDAVKGFGPKWKETRASAAAFCIAHSMDHYGQMVEYLRMNSINPPASRPQPKGSM